MSLSGRKNTNSLLEKLTIALDKEEFDKITPLVRYTCSCWLRKT